MGLIDYMLQNRLVNLKAEQQNFPDQNMERDLKKKKNWASVNCNS